MNPRKILVLASSSRYRRELLSRLKTPFETASPGVDEAAIPGERPAQTARRLAEAKARALSKSYPDALIIGADQVAELDGTPLGKPVDHDDAVSQLKRMSGRTPVFHTAASLYNSASGGIQTRVVSCIVTLRRLNDRQIEKYLREEQPYDCAGAAKIEGLGIALVEKMECEDATALIGLPLIALVEMLENEGVRVLGE